MDEWRWEEWIPHLEELRVRLIRAIIVYLIVVGVMWFFHKPILDFIARPVGKLYLFNVQDPFFVRLKIAFISALFFVFPYFIWEIWRFVEPALYPHERKAAALVLISVLLLFYSGSLMSVLVIVPRARSHRNIGEDGDSEVLLPIRTQTRDHSCDSDPYGRYIPYGGYVQSPPDVPPPHPPV